jgi:hypothetical protein
MVSQSMGETESHTPPTQKQIGGHMYRADRRELSEDGGGPGSGGGRGRLAGRWRGRGSNLLVEERHKFVPCSRILKTKREINCIVT